MTTHALLSRCAPLLVALLILSPATLLAQEVRLDDLTLLAEVTPRSLMVARVWSEDHADILWAGGRVDWRSRSLIAILGLSHRIATREVRRRRYALLLQTDGELLALAPLQPTAGMGLGVSLLNQWQWRRIELSAGVRARARTTLSDPVQATRTLSGLLTLSRRWRDDTQSIGIGAELGEVRDATGNAYFATSQLSYGF